MATAVSMQRRKTPLCRASKCTPAPSSCRHWSQLLGRWRGAALSCRGGGGRAARVVNAGMQSAAAACHAGHVCCDCVLASQPHLPIHTFSVQSPVKHCSAAIRARWAVCVLHQGRPLQRRPERLRPPTALARCHTDQPRRVTCRPAAARGRPHGRHASQGLHCRDATRGLARAQGGRRIGRRKVDAAQKRRDCKRALPAPSLAFISAREIILPARHRTEQP